MQVCYHAVMIFMEFMMGRDYSAPFLSLRALHVYILTTLLLIV